MKIHAAWLAVPALLAVAAFCGARSLTPPAGPQLAHMVFFTLKDQSKEARDAFVATCHKYLSGHEGVVYYSVGTKADDVVEAVSVRDFDVSLHLVFASKEAEAAYLKSPRHVEFVKVAKDGFAQVRVFDTYLTTTK